MLVCYFVVCVLSLVNCSFVEVFPLLLMLFCWVCVSQMFACFRGLSGGCDGFRLVECVGVMDGYC